MKVVTLKEGEIEAHVPYKKKNVCIANCSKVTIFQNIIHVVRIALQRYLNVKKAQDLTLN